MLHLKTITKVINANKELEYALVIAITLFILGIIALLLPGNNIESNMQSLVMALFGASLIKIIFEIVKLYYEFKALKYIEGEYKGHSYNANDLSKANELEYDTLNSKPVSRATIIYLGNKEFKIIVTHPYEGENKSTWEGILKMTSENMGDIGFKYTKYPHKVDLKYSAGYKKVVIINQRLEIAIYMYSNDNQRYGREVLLKSK